MINKIRTFIKDQRGESLITLPIVIAIMIIVLYMGIDVAGWFSTYQKLYRATSETLTLVKMENGWDNDTELYFDNMCTKEGLSPQNILVNATPKLVQRGETVEINTIINYEVRALRPLNRTITIPVSVSISGLAQEFNR